MEPPIQSGSELKQIFDSFDLDKSGSIDLKELKSVAAKLGKEISPQELSSVIKKLDSNKDGKISYGEFEYWWQKGMDGKMMELVYLRAKAMKLTNFVKKKAANLGISFEGHKGKQKPDKYSIRLGFGSEIKNSISIDMGFYIKGQKEIQLIEKIKKYAPDLKEKTFGVIMRLPSKNPAKAKAAMDHMLNSIVTAEDMPMKIESIQQNPLFKTKTVVAQNDLIIKFTLEPELQNAISPVSSSVGSVIGQIGQGFYTQFDFHFSLNSTFDQLLTDTILTNILRGFNFSLALQANNSALEKLRKFAEKNHIQIHPYFNLITLFRTAKFHLNIKSPEHLASFFKKLGIDDIVGGLPNMKDLLQQLSPMAREAKDKDLIMRLIYKLSRYALDHVENDVELFVLAGSIGTGYLRIQGKNASKIHSILFNEN